MGNRSFELFQMDLNLFPMFGATKVEKQNIDPVRGGVRQGSTKYVPCECSFSYEQSLILRRIRKRNTVFFDQFNKVLGLPYDMSDVRLDFQYDAIFVNMNSIPDDGITYVSKPCADDPNDDELVAVDNMELKEFLYLNGFTITGVPKRNPTTNCRAVNKENDPDVEDVHYRAFVASASMARKGQVLFVNDKTYEDEEGKKRNYYKELMERLTLGFYSYDETNHRLWMPTEETAKNAENPEAVFFNGDFEIPAAKFFAYLGLALSDGSSLEERSHAWTEQYGEYAGLPDLPELNEKTVFVAKDMKVDAAPYYKALGDYVWVIEPEENVLTAKKEEERLRWFFRHFSSQMPAETEGDKGWYAAVDKWYEYVEKERKNKNPEQLTFSGELSETDQIITRERFAYVWAMALLSKRDGKQEREKGGALDHAFSQLFEALKKELQNDQPEKAIWNTLKKLFGNRERFCIEIDGNGKSTASHGGENITFGFEAVAAKTYAAKLRNTKELKSSFSMFDGMGFCDNETFDQLEKMLLCREELDEKRRINAVIIRLPWLKGVLVRCDFMDFFEEKAGKSLRNTQIKDIFKQQRRLGDIHIIITDSMLKGYKYLTNLQTKGSKKKSETEKNLLDPWAYYWEMVRKYDISLLITGKNSQERKKERVNYQFLSTAGLSDETAERLCRETAKALMDDLNALKIAAEDTEQSEDNDSDPDIPVEEKAVENNDANEEPLQNPPETTNDNDTSDEDQDHGAIETFEALMDAADEETKKLLRQTGYVQTSAQSCARSRLLDAMKGRLEVPGDYRFVAPDLLAMLYYLYDKYVKFAGQDQENHPKLDSVLNTTDETCRGHGYYYAPGVITPWSEEDEAGNRIEHEIATLRNPHYAMGETAIVYPMPAEQRKEYDKWFGNLTSVVMLPATAVSTIGGADFDGDRCLCLADEGIISDIKANMERNKQNLTYMARHRDNYSALLNDTIETVGAGVLLKHWLQREDFIPPITEAQPDPRFRADCCPPLIFGDDSNHSMDFSCKDTDIEQKLYRSFVMTTKQRIGFLSLLALQYSDKAYQVGKVRYPMVDAARYAEQAVKKVEFALEHREETDWGTLCHDLEGFAEKIFDVQADADLEASLAETEKIRARARKLTDGQKKAAEEHARKAAERADLVEILYNEVETASKWESGNWEAAQEFVDTVKKQTEPYLLQWTSEEYANLQSWIWHWRMVSLGLECGVEIDMAKTGVQCVPTYLRENEPISAKLLYPHQVQLHDLFRNNANMLGTFRKLEKVSGSEGTVRQMLGSKLTDALLDRLLSWENTDGINLLSRSEDAKERPHNNVGLLPYRMYRAMLALKTPEEPLPQILADMSRDDLVLPFGDPRGTSLRAFFLNRLGISKVRKTGSNERLKTDKNTETETQDDDNQEDERQPISMDSLVWESEDRKGMITRYLQHYLSTEDAEQDAEEVLAEMQEAEVVDDEQGVYFLKEVAKFLHYSRLAKIANSDDTSITTEALSRQLKEIWPNDLDRLAYLCQYRKLIFDEIQNKYKGIMDDHLFLALVGKDISSILKPWEGKQEEHVLDRNLCKKADKVIMDYAKSKMRRSNHAVTRIRMEDRYRYCMRNLQRRYSLARSLRTLINYGTEYKQTPIGKMGVPQEKLRRVFADMEEMK